jgi:RNA methyltransferase, TrmH family
MAKSQARSQARPARPPQGDRSRTRSAKVLPTKLLRVAGLPAVAALFATAPQRVERLFFDQRMRAQVGDFCAELARSHKPYRLLPSAELERVAGSAMHGGVVAMARPQPLPALDLAKAADWARSGEPLLLLDGIGNPHNLGAIVRTAAFFGLPRIVLSDHPAQAGPSDASYRVAEGGLEYVELHRGVRFVNMLQQLRRSYRVIGTAAGNGQSIEALRRTERPGDRPLAVVLGNEEHGLPPATLAACEAIITIPGSGLVQSLNVAASAAILLHALAKRA